MTAFVPRPRSAILDELHRCAGTRAQRLDELIEALIRLDALDHRMTDLVDELALHPREAA